MPEWDLREQVLIARWQELGHALRAMGETGAAACLRCGSIIHIRNRAAAASGEGLWGASDPMSVRPCVKSARVTHLTRR